MKLFLDIEGVLIEDLTHPVILDDNVASIKRLIETEKPTSIETFSFGLWDKNDFDTWSRINDTLFHRGIKIITQSIGSEKLKLAFLKSVLGSVRKEEIHDFPGVATKDRAFEWFVKEFQSDISDCTLIDDTVETKKIITKHQSITIINIVDV